jgi:hypothetical protein
MTESKENRLVKTLILLLIIISQAADNTSGIIC